MVSARACAMRANLSLALFYPIAGHYDLVLMCVVVANPARNTYICGGIVLPLLGEIDIR